MESTPGEWRNKVQYINTTESCTAEKMNELQLNNSIGKNQNYNKGNKQFLEDCIQTPVISLKISLSWDVNGNTMNIKNE